MLKTSKILAGLSFFLLAMMGVIPTAQAIVAPADLITHSQSADAKVILSWAPVTGATEYRVLRGTTLGTYSQIAVVSGVSYVDSTFSTTATNYYVVRAFAGTESANSNAVSFTPHEITLSPDRIVIIVNDAMTGSVEVGTYYSTQRGVPAGNICHVTTVTTETCTGPEYTSLATSIGNFLDSNNLRNSTYCLLTTYGIPLRRTDNNTSVDNNLATLRTGSASNDYYSAGLTLQRRYNGSYSVYMVTRIDGATKDIAKALVDKAKTAEANANFYTSGIGVFDARNHAYNSAYTVGDIYARDAFLAARRIGLTAYLDNADGPILAGAVTSNVILYWGWYTHYYGAPNQNYPPTLTFAELQEPFTFATGAVAVHLESDTCDSVRRTDPADWTAHTWVAWMINHEGVTATGGAVSEPFLNGFAEGDTFNETLTKGFTFAEAAYISTSMLNWMMCWVGDPLYTPFGKRLANHQSVFGKRIIYNQIVPDSRYDEIGNWDGVAATPNRTYYSQTYGVVDLHHYGASDEHRYVLDFQKIFASVTGPVPNNAAIVMAKALVRSHHNGAPNGPLSFNRITDPDSKGTWKEAMPVIDTDNVGVSWAYRDASTSVPWDNANTQGGTLSTTDIINTTGQIVPRRLIDQDVTTHVQLWANGTVNQGWMLTLPSGQGKSFWGGSYVSAMVDAPLLEVYWNSAPVAEAGSDQSVLTGSVVQFDGTGSYDPDFGPNALSYSWDFDVSNGIQVDATGASPTHVYAASGIYTVTLTISDGKTTATDTLTVTASGTDTTPPNVTITQAVLTGTVYDAGSCPASVVIDGTITVPVTSADGHNGTWASNPIDISSPSDMLVLTASDPSGNTRTVQLSISH